MNIMTKGRNIKNFKNERCRIARIKKYDDLIKYG